MSENIKFKCSCCGEIKEEWNALAFIYTDTLSGLLKEDFELTAILTEETTPAQADSLLPQLKKSPFIKKITYLSKEDAVADYIAKTGEDFRPVLDGFNPLFASYLIKLNAGWVQPDSLIQIEKKLLTHPPIQEVHYYMPLLDAMWGKLHQYNIIGAIMLFLFVLATFFMIDNTIKLSMYANRFLVRSMDLVGATRSFIAQPFTRQAAFYGLISAIIAIILVWGVRAFLHYQIPELSKLMSNSPFIGLCAIMLFAGVVISWVSTRIAVYKYLSLGLDDLY